MLFIGSVFTWQITWCENVAKPLTPFDRSILFLVLIITLCWMQKKRCGTVRLLRTSLEWLISKWAPLWKFVNLPISKWQQLSLLFSFDAFVMAQQFHIESRINEWLDICNTIHRCIINSELTIPCVMLLYLILNFAYKTNIFLDGR